MKRDVFLFIEDIFESIKNIEDFSENLTEDKFVKDELRQSAVIRQLEIIGEATKNIPEDFRKKYKNIEWQKMAGLRDVLIHAYFGADLTRVWKVVKNELPILKKQIREILKKEKKK